MRHLSVRLGSAAAFAMAAAVFATAQTAPPQDQEQPPRFRVGASFVRIDAYPLRNGKPVLDLGANDFEVFEDGVLQKIETFEHVQIRAGGPQDERREPSSQRESLAAISNPRNRVFVIFLDVPHVSIPSAHAINEPLIRLIDRILGPDDLVGVMTTEMAASQIVFGRKTQVIADSLRANWPWGTRHTYQYDKREEAYQACYAPLFGERIPSALASELIKRKRERATLEAMQDLVRYLRTVREERKAILTVTEGWLLYRPNQGLMKLREDPVTGYKEPVPTGEPIGVGPNGKLTTKDPRRIGEGALSKSECDADRLMLAMMDNDRFFKDLLQEANFANASFYPIDPRGLPAFDNPIGPEPPPPITVDLAMLKQRIEIMRTLAENTDGLAVVDNNDLDRGLRRISDDLTSYYLLGYNSTNAKLDGKYRSVKVRVKQPGITVRARQGYRAPVEAEVVAARRAADAPVPEITRATTAAIDRLGRIRPEARFRINVVPASRSAIWVAGELQAAASGQPDEFTQGGTASIDVSPVGGGGSTSAKVALKPGDRTFLTRIELPASGPTDVQVRARLTSTNGPLPVSDMLQVDIGELLGQPLLFRRGVTTGNRLLPAADYRFSRTERLRLEFPATGDARPGSGRVLDRSGQPLQVPVMVTERKDDATGMRWIVADVTLAPLSVGDYAVEVSIAGATEQRVITGIRVAR
ncbi:MAG TPA: VWA domain-containing protein [Vicinamibacterales bacterium]